MSLLLTLSMTPVVGVQPALADESVARPATTGGDMALESTEGEDAVEDAGQPVAAVIREDGALIANGLVYATDGDVATLVGFEDGAALEGELVVPARLTDGVFGFTVERVDIAEGQAAPSVVALALPQTVERVETEGLALALPSLTRIEVDGTDGVYSSSSGLLFRRVGGAASSGDASAKALGRELVWAPPAMTVARIPGTCASIAAGAFVDDAALEAVVVFGSVGSIAKTERDADGNVTEPGAFTDEQVATVGVVLPPTRIVVSSGAKRVSASVLLSDIDGDDDRRVVWEACGFDSTRIIEGDSDGSGANVVSVDEDAASVGEPAFGGSATFSAYSHSEGVVEPSLDGVSGAGDEKDFFSGDAQIREGAFDERSPSDDAASFQGDSSVDGMTLESNVASEGGISAYDASTKVYRLVVTSNYCLSSVEFLNGVSLGSTVIDDLPHRVTYTFSGPSNTYMRLYANGGMFRVSDGTYDLPMLCINSSTGATDAPGHLYFHVKEGFVVTGYTVSYDVAPTPAVTSDGYNWENFYDACTFFVHITGLSTTSSVFGGYATKNWANDQFAEKSSMSDMATRTWVDGKGYITKSANNLDHYYTKSQADTQVADALKSYTNTVDLNAALAKKANVADVYTKTVADSTFAKKGELSSYVTTTALAEDLKGYYTKADANRAFATKGELAEAKDAAEGARSAADAAKATADAAKTVADGVKGTADKNAADIAGLKSAATAQAERVGALETTVGDASGGLVKQAADNAAGIADLTAGLGEKADAADVYTKGEADSAFAKKGDLKDWALESDVYTKTESDGRFALAEGNATREWVEGKGYVAVSEFGTIAYDEASMEGVTSKAVMPTAYRAGSVPAIPEPEREGFEFVGWSWNRGGEGGAAVAGGAGELAEAFSEAGNVVLTAEWEAVVPGASGEGWFFSGGDPLSGTAAGEQTSVVAVELSGSPAALSGVSFSDDGSAGVLKDGAWTGLSFWVDNEASTSGEPKPGWSATGESPDMAFAEPVPLARLGEGSWGLYVGVRVPAGAVDPAKVVKSYSPGSYVVPLVTLNYEFA